jgi:hypothetical protein
MAERHCETGQPVDVAENAFYRCGHRAGHRYGDAKIRRLAGKANMQLLV